MDGMLVVGEEKSKAGKLIFPIKETVLLNEKTHAVI
jgi:hypothetical protein